METKFIEENYLEEKIREFKEWYTDTLVNIVKLPTLIKACEKALQEEWITEERKKALQWVLDWHKSNLKANYESLEQLEEIIPLIENLPNN